MSNLYDNSDLVQQAHEAGHITDEQARAICFKIFQDNLNDEQRNVLTRTEIRLAMEQNQPAIPKANEKTVERSVARSLFEFKTPPKDDPSELLRHRYLCKGGGLLLVGATGLGKSSLTMQLAIKWAMGQPAFGFEPTKPLKSLFIQAENDDGDLAEMRNGIIKGTNLDLTDEVKKLLDSHIYIITEDRNRGAELFGKVLEPMLKTIKPDILWIDTALAFFDGDMNNQKDVGEFLRTQLNPVLHKYSCAAVVIHHTNKISNSPDKPITDPAYLGAGSAEWANWSRAVLALRKTDVDNLYELIAGKRGSRLKWKGIDNQSTVLNRYIMHIKQPDTICWMEVAMVDAEELKAGNGKTADDVLKHVPTTGLISKEELVKVCRRNSLGRNLALGLIEELVADGSVFEHKAKRANARPKLLITREGKQVDPVPFLEQYQQDSQGIYHSRGVNPLVTHPVNLVGANLN
jgi:RecA-family ATPase